MAIEVKAAASLSGRDLAGIWGFRETAGDRFLREIVLYGGSETLTFGEDVWALPVNALWSG